jgi:hypothetical protein
MSNWLDLKTTQKQIRTITETNGRNKTGTR